MGRKKNSNLLYSMLLVVFMGIFFVLFVSPAINFNFGQQYIFLIPSLIMLLVSIYGIKNTKPGPGKLGCFFILGLTFAFMVDQFNTLGMMTAEILHGLTVLQFQLGLVILTTCVGAYYSIT